MRIPEKMQGRKRWFYGTTETEGNTFNGGTDIPLNWQALEKLGLPRRGLLGGPFSMFAWTVSEAVMDALN
jgi:hypothetical protein